MRVLRGCPHARLLVLDVGEYAMRERDELGRNESAAYKQMRRRHLEGIGLALANPCPLQAKRRHSSERSERRAAASERAGGADL